MALILAIELNKATFEDLATLVSTAGAAGADDSTFIEIDEEQQQLRVIIEEPIAPDVDTSDPTEFRLVDDGYNPRQDPNFGPNFDDEPEDFEDYDSAFYDAPAQPRGHQNFGSGGPFDISGVINDFIDNIASEFNLGGRRNRPGRQGHHGRHGGFRGRGMNGFPSPDYLYGLAEDYFRDYGYRGNPAREDERRQAPRPDDRFEEPLQDDFYSDESLADDSQGDEPRNEEPRNERSRNPFDEAFKSPFSGPGNDFGELRDAGESFLKGLSDFINDRVDRRTDGNEGSRGGNQSGRKRPQGYGTFGNPDLGDAHPEGTSRRDKDTEEKLGEFTDFSGYDNLGDIEDIEDIEGIEDTEGTEGTENPDNAGTTDAGSDSESEVDHDGEYSPGDDSGDDAGNDSGEDSNGNRDDK